ncbi:MAG: hypothetical protein KJO54_01240 [Gammaproteobacteria bacterium]|nr:hypothetical protein [Gammaproteobacteria bacterium]
MQARAHRHFPLIAATGALLLGCAVYLYARPLSVFATGMALAPPYSGQLPTFLHTFGFGIAAAVLASSRPVAALLCWCCAEFVAEVLQLGRFAEITLLHGYASRSTFDIADLAAALLATAAAWTVLVVTRRDHR